MNADERELQAAYFVAENSTDTSTQNGAVILGSSFKYFGVNDLLPLVKRESRRYERPTKYLYTEHAERAAIFNAVRYNANLYGSTLYCPWAACADCARAIIGTGVARLVRHKEAMDRVASQMWLESIQAADDMMGEVGIEVVTIDAEIERPTLLFNGEPW